jgi:MraZ protein
MFVGKTERNIDGAGRIILPPSHRAVLGEFGYLAMYPDCLALWPPASWEKFVNELVEEHEANEGDIRGARRALFSNAEVVKPDAQGRIPIKEELRVQGGLTKAVVLAGNGDHLEIWDAETWRSVELQDAAALSTVVSSRGL